MRVKHAVFIAYLLGVVMQSALGTVLFASPAEPQQAGGEQVPRVIRLDEWGRRGVVFFDHKGHESVISPDAAWPHKATAGAACAGCHHTTNAKGIPQLFKCNVCHHRREGDPRNPKNRDFDEVMAERAFHDSCIECHRSSNKGPVTCSGCHKAGIPSATVANPARQQ